MNILANKRLYVVGIISLGLGILFDYLFYDKFFGISYLIYTVSLLVGLFALLTVFKVPYNKKAVVWFLPGVLFFALMVGVRANFFIHFWNMVLTIAFLLLSAHQLSGRNIRKNLFLDYLKTAVVLPLSMLGRSFNALGRMLSVGKGERSGKNAQIIKGILITVPIVLFFLFLLSSADLVFKELINNLFSFNFNISEDVLAQIWWAAVFTLVWLGAYTYILEKSSVSETSSAAPVARNFKFGNIEAGILFTTLNVLFLTFVAIQIRYLFAGHNAITQFGFTYAEYAHKGFGELVAVALLSFGLVFLAERYVERSDSKPSLLFKTLTGVLMALVLVIMVSAFMRLAIYEQAYGFTLARILVQAFIVWLAAVFLWLGYKIIKGLEDRPFVFGLFLSVISFFVFINLFNPDAFVARKNISQSLETGELDTKYLSSLSADAIPELMPLLEMPGVKDKYGNELSKEVAIALKGYYDSAVNEPWQSYSVSRNRAVGLISNKLNLISTLTK